MAYPKKNTQFIFDVALIDATARPSLRANPTLAAGDVKVSTDEGAFANAGTLPSVAPASGTNVKVTLSTSEMNGDRVVVQFIDQTSPKEWDDVLVVINIPVVNVDDLVRSTTPANTLDVAATGEAGLDFDNIHDSGVAQPGQETPAATQTWAKMLAYLYKAWRNKTTQTATAYNLFNDDASTVDQKATTADDLTTFTRGEVATGP